MTLFCVRVGTILSTNFGSAGGIFRKNKIFAFLQKKFKTHEETYSGDNFCAQMMCETDRALLLYF